MEVLELKTRIRNKKIYWLTDILHTANEKISEMENLAIYTIQNKALREKKLKSKWREPQWPMSKYQTSKICVIRVLKERGYRKSLEEIMVE